MARKRISETERCRLFEKISKSIWSRLVRAHRVNTDLKEVGLTADIIVDILNFNIDEVANFEIYAKPGWNEDIYGSDIDLFIETAPNHYRWFALQAKVLKKNNRYTSLRQVSHGTMQWEKLALLEAISRCKSYYLLYNGHNSFKEVLPDDCKGAFVNEQYGCTFVEPRDIERLANVTAGGTFVSPTFEDFHPQHAIPWRMLTYCLHATSNMILYPKNEVLKSNLAFVLFEELPPDDEPQIYRVN